MEHALWEVAIDLPALRADVGATQLTKDERGLINRSPHFPSERKLQAGAKRKSTELFRRGGLGR